VAPMAHYTIGGVRVDASMATTVPGLWAAGEAVGGAHRAKRPAGHALTEALEFGARAGDRAAASAMRRTSGSADDVDTKARADMREARGAVESRRGRRGDGDTTPRLRRRLQRVMWDHAGPFRTDDELAIARRELAELA